MEKYKHLKGAAHNWAHSFLSIENFDAQGNYFIGLLYVAAKYNNAPKLVINLLNGDLSPNSAVTHELSQFSKSIPWEFSKFLLKHSCNANMVKHARLELEFNLNASDQELPDISSTFIFANKSKAPAQCIYTAKVILIDDKNKEHNAKVEEWWKY
jgi:hypothetical protein